MTRTLTITAAEWASRQDGTLWLGREGVINVWQVSMGPPAEFMQACAPCETCAGSRQWWDQNAGPSGDNQPCADCRIELVEPADWCEVCQQLPVLRCVLNKHSIMAEGAVKATVTLGLVHYGPPESLVGKWALRVQVVR